MRLYRVNVKGFFGLEHVDLTMADGALAERQIDLIVRGCIPFENSDVGVNIALCCAPLLL